MCNHCAVVPIFPPYCKPLALVVMHMQWQRRQLFPEMVRVTFLLLLVDCLHVFKICNFRPLVSVAPFSTADMPASLFKWGFAILYTRQSQISKSVEQSSYSHQQLQ